MATKIGLIVDDRRFITPRQLPSEYYVIVIGHHHRH